MKSLLHFEEAGEKEGRVPKEGAYH